MKYDEMMNKAIEMLKNDDELFCNMIDELDSYNGFADGFKCWEMYCLDDFYCNVSATKLLEDIDGNHFSTCDEYFCFTDNGLESVADKYERYLDNTTEEEVLDNVIENYSHLYFSDNDFKELIESIVNFEEDEEES